MGKRHRNENNNNWVNEQETANKIDITPRNPRQRFYLKSITEHQLTFGIGPAGTGKTYIAASAGAKMLLRGEISHLIIVRPAVAAAGEEHGFLPGDLKRKLAPWARPITAILKQHLGGQKLDEMIAQGVVETMPFTYMRGLTFDNSLVILDEAQNTTPAQMKLFLTRIGEGTKAIIDGDISQSDIKGTSGLGKAIALARKWSIPCGLVEFTADDVVRSQLCKLWVEAFENEEADNEEALSGDKKEAHRLPRFLLGRR